MGTVVYLDNITTLDIPPERVLKGGLEAELDEAVVIGYDKNGELYFAASSANGPDVVWLLEMAKKKLLEISAEDL